MNPVLEVVIASSGPEPFKLLDGIIRSSGHRPVAYVVSRSMRPGTPSESEFVALISEVVSSIPDGMDLLLPGRSGGLEKQLIGYQPDLMIVSGFNWKLSPDVLRIPRLGVLNVHPSFLPKYRGPSPMLWAIRNGDTHFGITVHRMDEDIDSGPVMSRSEPILLPDHVTHKELWDLFASALPEVLAEAIQKVTEDQPGQPQDHTRATPAGFPPDSWFTIDWADSRVSIYHQLRVLRLLRPDDGMVTEVSGKRLRIRAGSLNESVSGLPVQCGDGVIWLTDYENV